MLHASLPIDPVTPPLDPAYLADAKRCAKCACAHTHQSRGAESFFARTSASGTRRPQRTLRRQSRTLNVQANEGTTGCSEGGERLSGVSCYYNKVFISIDFGRDAHACFVEVNGRRPRWRAPTT